MQNPFQHGQEQEEYSYSEEDGSQSESQGQLHETENFETTPLTQQSLSGGASIGDNQPSQWEATEDNNFGFQGLPEDPAITEARAKKAEESVKTKELKEKIRVLLTRYNRLIPRTSHALMQKLEGLTEGELDNVYKNCLTDVQEIRGMKAAECVVLGITYPMDVLLLPTYTEHCLRDQELLRDIDAELQDMVGYFSNRAQILIRLLSNAYEVYCKRGMLSSEKYNDYEMSSYVKQQAISRRREMELNDVSLNPTQPVIQPVSQLPTKVTLPSNSQPFGDVFAHSHETI